MTIDFPEDITQAQDEPDTQYLTSAGKLLPKKRPLAGHTLKGGLKKTKASVGLNKKKVPLSVLHTPTNNPDKTIFS